MDRQFKLCHFVILEYLTLYSSFNTDAYVYVCVYTQEGDQYTLFASSEDYSLLGIIP